MSEKDFQNWLKSYGQAWEDKNIDKFVSLFSKNAEYYWTPFDLPKKGISEIADAVNSAVSTQSDIKFTFQVLAFANNTGICRWWCRFNRILSGSLIKLDGIFYCEFDRNHSCHIFREWWHKEGE